MQIVTYKKIFSDYFNEPIADQMINESCTLIKENAKRIFFIGNGGSNSICSHMMEDFAKLLGYPTFAFSDAALITCFANDYGYENAMAEWLKIHLIDGDLLVAISSSGESKNIIYAAETAKARNSHVISLTGFKESNTLRTKGDINFHIPISNYGIVECYHQVILHIILDTLYEKR